MPHKFDTIDVTIEEGVALVTLNRPEKYNPLNQKMGDDLFNGFTAFRKDNDARVIVLTGAGKAFSAGGDIDDIKGGALKSDYMMGRDIGRLVQTIANIEKPVICAVNGIAAGAGAGLVLACDVIYASEKAKFSEIYANIGMVPDMGNLWFLPRVVGPYKAKELCFSADIIDAEEMYRLGIAQKVFQPEELIPKTMEFAKKLAQGPALSYKLSKSFIDRGLRMTLDQFFDLEALAVVVALQTDDVREGVSAFIEKRKPVYKGS
jgi:2-(1,2-epoxy-1,2-dihydrophenyl)acetyl-CoA isomerase